MIDAYTRLYGIIGNPVRHSLSPAIHNGVFERMGVNAAYVAFEVSNLADAMAGVRALGVQGLSVTVPFKEEVIPFLDALEPTAEKIGAVNTIASEAGRLVGYNTDWFGAIEALQEKAELEGKMVLLLGAGGAARAIAFGLRQKGSRVAIWNRSPEKAKVLSEEMGCLHIPQLSAIDIPPDIIINATSAGMWPHTSQSPLPQSYLNSKMLVMDIVYTPLNTRLIREAEGQGCSVIDGLEMLAHQAVRQFEIWTGMKPSATQIKEDLRRALESRNRPIHTQWEGRFSRGDS